MTDLRGDHRSSTVQIPDSEPVGIIVGGPTMQWKPSYPEVIDLFPGAHEFAHSFCQSCSKRWPKTGTFWFLNDFSVLNRKGYEEFCSYLQASVDRLSAKAEQGS